ncbi:MAG TPA: hypothetical protein VHA37_03560, partial [Candidatus Saccharimonadales bacterium]|nr:hypothetical protein [Candidatus Saccharimonadales bacterium]
DLRHDPTPFLDLSVDELTERWQFTKDPDAPPRLPVKTLKYNRCPAVAPLGVMKDTASQQRLNLTLESVAKNRALLRRHQQAFADKVLQAVARLDAKREAAQTSLVDNQLTVDERLYDSFISDADKAMLSKVRTAKPEQLGEFSFRDERLTSLLPLYKARNYPASLTSEERAVWEMFCRQRLFEGGTSSRLARYFARLEELATGAELNGEQRYLLEELQLYGQSIVPAEADDGAAG